MKWFFFRKKCLLKRSAVNGRERESSRTLLEHFTASLISILVECSTGLGFVSSSIHCERLHDLTLLSTNPVWMSWDETLRWQHRIQCCAANRVFTRETSFLIRRNALKRILWLNSNERYSFTLEEIFKKDATSRAFKWFDPSGCLCQ